MREAIGSSWFLGVAAIFIALFCTFLGISINYTKSFNVKNALINAIEEKEGYKALYAGQNRTTINDNVVKKFGYIQLNDKNYTQYENACKNALGITGTNSSFAMGGTRSSGGYAYCVQRVCQSGGGSYYKVITFAAMEIPIVGLDIKIPISGETKAIYCDINDTSCKRTGSGCPIN